MIDGFIRRANKMIRLAEIDKSNWLALAKLSVQDSQKGFVADNSVSMAQAHYEEGNFPLGIYVDDVPVGFCMYGRDEESCEHWIIRLMIDKRHQSKGFGRGAMSQLVARMRKEFGEVPIYLSFEPENAWGRSLYESLGFVPDGRVMDGEIVYRLDV